MKIMVREKVTIYSSTGCVACEKAKAFFNRFNISYEEKNISGAPELAEEMVRVSGQMAVPVIMVGSHVLPGFNPRRIQELLSKKVTV